MRVVLLMRAVLFAVAALVLVWFATSPPAESWPPVTTGEISPAVAPDATPAPLNDGGHP